MLIAITLAKGGYGLWVIGGVLFLYLLYLGVRWASLAPSSPNRG
jgi:hypothetical protein